MKHVFLVVLVIFTCGSSFGQASIKDSSIALTSVGIQYSADFPAGEFANDYGFMSGIGGDVFFKFRSNWSLGVDVRYRFGNTLKNSNLFGDYQADGGIIISNNGWPADVRLSSTGWDASLTVSKLFPWFGPNDNSGLNVRLGLGLLTHKVFIDPRDAYIPQFVDPYRKGYDRLHMGPQAKQGIYYLHYGSKQQWLNFSIGFELTEAFTTNVRQYNYAEAAFDTDWQWDFMYSIKVAYILPIYKKSASNIGY